MVIDPDYSFGAPTVRGKRTYIISELAEPRSQAVRPIRHRREMPGTEMGIVGQKPIIEHSECWGVFGTKETPSRLA